MSNSYEITVYGEPASKANSRRLVAFGGKPRFVKSKKALDYKKAFDAQCPQREELIEGDVRLTVTIYYATRRPDLDESLIMDLLEGVAYKNDRQIKEKHIYHGLDKENPRAEILVESIACSP